MPQQTARSHAPEICRSDNGIEWNLQTLNLQNGCQVDLGAASIIEQAVMDSPMRRSLVSGP